LALSTFVLANGDLTILSLDILVFRQSSIAAAVQYTLPLIGSAMFASGLPFFLVEMTRSNGR
jgi:hypothetical protein